MYAAEGGGGRGWNTADADARAFRVWEINIGTPTDKRLSFDLMVFLNTPSSSLLLRHEMSRNSALLGRT